PGRCGDDRGRLALPDRDPVRGVRAPGRAHRARRREAAEGISDQRRHLRARAFGRGHAPAWTVLRRPGADQAPSRAGRARGGVRDPRVLARRRAPSRPREGQPRRGRGAPGLTRIAVVGLGYVGLTLSVALAKKGVTVLGYDREPRVVGALQTGRPHLYEPGVAEELPALLEERLRVVPELPREPVDGAVLCVSTPVDPVTREPVLEPLRDAARAVAAAFDSDTLVVVRSTVPVGASRAVVLPELVARWGRARLAFCPERTIQGQALRELEELPQIVGGLDGPSRDAAAALFRRFLELLRETRGGLEGGRVLLLGFAYKGWPPTDDMRGAPVLPMLDVLRGAGLALRGHDFLVAREVLAGLGVTPASLSEGFAGADGILVITDHPEYAKLDLPALLASLRKPALVYDCWRVLDQEAVRAAGEVRYASIGYG